MSKLEAIVERAREKIAVAESSGSSRAVIDCGDLRALIDAAGKDATKETRHPCPGGCDNGVYSGPHGKVPCITCCPRTPNGDLDLAAFERGERSLSHAGATPTPADADELLDLVAGLRGNFDEDDRYADRIELAVAAERARHAEEVAELIDVGRSEHAHLDELRDVEIPALGQRIRDLEAENTSLRDQLHQATELVSVLEERLDAFEDTEPDARACAEWVVDITQDGDMRQAARRYLSGVANRTATRLHRDLETLRDQLRKVEEQRARAREDLQYALADGYMTTEQELHGYRVAIEAAVDELVSEDGAGIPPSLQQQVRNLTTDLATERNRLRQMTDQLRKVEGERDDARAQVAEVQHEHDALLQRADQAERELGAWQDWALTHCDPGDGADDRHLRELVGAALTSLRSLLPDVRLIAESAMYETTGGESCPEVLTREARAARNILAALDSRKDGV